ncbi:MAG: GGDEF domain-containing protein [Acidiferrobacterales bacterium]
MDANILGVGILQGNSIPSVESKLLRRVVGLLEGLKQSATGIVIHDQIVRLLQDCETEQAQVEQTYISLLYFLLEAYAKNPSSEHVLRVTAKLIQLRPALSMATVADLRGELLSESARADESSGDDLDAFENAIEGLLGSLERAPVSADTPPPAPAVVVTDKPVVAAPPPPPPAPAPPKMRPEPAEPGIPVPPVVERWSVERRTRSSEKTMQKILEQEEANGSPFVDRRVNSAYRLHLDRKRDQIDRLQETLANKVAEAIAQNREFGALLEIERGALQQADSINDIENMRQILIGGIDELIKGQRALAAKLRGSNDYLQLVKSDSERLHDELNKVRLLSLTDEFTGLPNRRAFMRRLEDEIGRAQRYSTPLALAIIDLDEFKAINDNYGHSGGDDVLRFYATDVLSIFRHHDMVARYGGEEFSVLLPNTGLEGAASALRKVQQRIATSTFESAGQIVTLPTFSAGLTLYVPSELPHALIDRADQALYRAKGLGRNRVEIGGPAVGPGQKTEVGTGNGNGNGDRHS